MLVGSEVGTHENEVSGVNVFNGVWKAGEKLLLHLAGVSEVFGNKTYDDGIETVDGRKVGQTVAGVNV